MSTELS